MNDDELQEMIDEADRDGDGEISEEEFIRIMKKTNLFWLMKILNWPKYSTISLIIINKALLQESWLWGRIALLLEVV